MTLETVNGMCWIMNSRPQVLLTGNDNDTIAVKATSNHRFMSATNYTTKLECGPMPNVMVTLPNIGGTLCSMPQGLADAHYYMQWSNTAKVRYPLKFAGVPQTTGSISAARGPKFTIL